MINHNSSLIVKETVIGQDTFVPVTHQALPSWNSTGRPKKAKAGTIGFNFKTKHLEYWNGVSWLKLPMRKI